MQFLLGCPKLCWDIKEKNFLSLEGFEVGFDGLPKIFFAVLRIGCCELGTSVVSFDSSSGLYNWNMLEISPSSKRTISTLLMNKWIYFHCSHQYVYVYVWSLSLDVYSRSPFQERNEAGWYAFMLPKLKLFITSEFVYFSSSKKVEEVKEVRM